MHLVAPLSSRLDEEWRAVALWHRVASDERRSDADDFVVHVDADVASLQAADFGGRRLSLFDVVLIERALVRYDVQSLRTLALLTALGLAELFAHARRQPFSLRLSGNVSAGEDMPGRKDLLVSGRCTRGSAIDVHAGAERTHLVVRKEGAEPVDRRVGDHVLARGARKTLLRMHIQRAIVRQRCGQDGRVGKEGIVDVGAADEPRPLLALVNDAAENCAHEVGHV
jgi:hypothetical protein